MISPFYVKNTQSIRQVNREIQKRQVGQAKFAKN